MPTPEDEARRLLAQAIQDQGDPDPRVLHQVLDDLGLRPDLAARVVDLDGRRPAGWPDDPALVMPGLGRQLAGLAGGLARLAWVKLRHGPRAQLWYWQG